MSGLARPTPDVDRRIAWLVFAGILAVYLAVSRGEYYAYDAHSMAAVTRNLVDHGTLTTTGQFVDSFGYSTPYAPYGIAASILAIPAYLVSKALGHEQLLFATVNPLLLAATCSVIYRIGHSLRWSRQFAILAAVVFGLFTMALQASTEFFSEPGVTLCVTAMVLGLLEWRAGARRGMWIVGLSAAACIQFRQDSLATVWIGLAALPLFVPWRDLARAQVVRAVALPMSVSLLALVSYNQLRWGSLLSASYGTIPQGFTTPLHLGLRGLLISPGKSLFIFNAPTALGVVGLWHLARRDRPLAVLFAVLVVPRILFFAKWASWDGGWAWGPRFLLPLIPILVISAVELLRSRAVGTMAARLMTGATVSLLVLAGAVGYLSVRVPYEQWDSIMATPQLRAQYESDGVRVPDAASGMVPYMYAYAFDVRSGPINGNILLLRHGDAQMAPHWWRAGSHEVIGWLLLFAGGAILAATLGVAAFVPSDDVPSAVDDLGSRPGSHV